MKRTIEKIHWNVRTACNLPCSFCYLWRRPGVSGLRTEDAAELLVQSSRVTSWFVFGGGDPLMREDLVDLLGVAKRVGLRVELQTNAELLDEALAPCFPFLDRIGFSLDGDRSEVHDAMRGRAGNFDRNLRAIALANDFGIPITVRTLVTAVNAHSLGALGERLRGFSSIKKWSIRQFAPLGRGERSRKRFEVTHREFAVVAQVLRGQEREFPFVVDAVSVDDLEDCYCLIAPDGTVYGHPSRGEDYRAVGSFPRETLADIVERLPYNRGRRKATNADILDGNERE